MVGIIYRAWRCMVSNTGQVVLNSHTTEIISSLLRWFFLGFILLLVYFPPVSQLLGYNQGLFLYLSVFSFIYILTAQIFLHTFDEQS
jgi:hypothetical protein